MTNKIMCITEHAKEFISKLCLFKISCPKIINLQGKQISSMPLLYFPATPGARQIQNDTNEVV